MSARSRTPTDPERVVLKGEFDLVTQGVGKSFVAVNERLGVVESNNRIQATRVETVERRRDEDRRAATLGLARLRADVEACDSLLRAHVAVEFERRTLRARLARLLAWIRGGSR